MQQAISADNPSTNSPTQDVSITEENRGQNEQKNTIKVLIQGIDSEPLDNVNNTLSLKQYKKRPEYESVNVKTIKRMYKRSENEIRAALRPFGYYNVTINSNLDNRLVENGLTSTIANEWTAQFTIQLGTAVIINNVDVSVSGAGKKETAIMNLQTQPELKIGEQLSHQRYSRYKQTLYSTLFDLGYLDVKYTRSEMQVDIENNSANIVLHLDSGEQYFFGDIVIEQNTINPDKINRLINIDEDTPFNADKLIQLQLRLSETGYFSDIEVKVDKENTINQGIPVTIKAQAEKKLKYSLSGGYGTDTGARVGANFLNRRINKRGHRFQTSIQLSEVENIASAQYSIPIGNIANEKVTIFTTIDEEKVNDTDTTAYSLGTKLQQQAWQGQRILFLTLLQEQFSFDGTGNQTANLLIPGMIYHYKELDAPLFSRKGFSVTADIHGGIESGISETSFFHTKLSARSVLPIGNYGRLLNRLEIGYIESDEFDALPPSERFFTGGAQTVRGYAYKDIGSRDGFDNNIGGNRLLNASIEVDYLAWGNFGFALFYDIGDVTEDQSFDFKTAAGLGLRYRSPIGMVRIDLAHPFDRIGNNEERDIRLHISIGPDL